MTIPKVLYPLLLGEPVTREMEIAVRTTLIRAGAVHNPDVRKEATKVIKAIADAIGVKKLRKLAWGIPYSLIEQVLKDE
jgi:hypothetical protein